MQLRRLMSSLTNFHLDCHKLFDGVKLFPIEVDLARTAFQYSQDSAGGHGPNAEDIMTLVLFKNLFDSAVYRQCV